MRVALIMDLSERRGSGYIREAAAQFVRNNTLLINKAELQELADAGDLARDEPTTVIRLVGKSTTIL
jgi:hypothetical protein